MPNWDSKKLGEVKADEGAKDKKKALKAPQAKASKPTAAAKPAAKAAVASRKTATVARSRRGDVSGHLIRRGGTLYLAECDVPVWRLEMARRAGSGPAALIEAFPGLTPDGLDRAFEYARRHRTAIDRQIRAHGPTEVFPGGEPDDGADFERELGELLDRDAPLYRRLAQ